MTKKTVVIDGVTYTSREALKRAARERMPKATSHKPTEIPLTTFWQELIAGHATIDEKFGRFGADNAVAFGYRKNLMGDGTSMGFIGADGEFMPFSYKTAAEGHFPPADPEGPQRANVIDGMRRSIRPQIEAYRATLPRLGGKVQCAVTGEWLDPYDIEIDHHPREFAALAKEYLEIAREDHGGALPEIEKHDAGHPDHNKIKDPVWEEAWRLWHESEASYQPLSKAAHYAKKRSK
ncbi:MAG: hypothetical protein ACT6QM_05880 [Brevundimonas mediterranea]|uniref:hypothetical protein n=1 Tax=Brevundimonas mediterranea TaxID=74329 RepID=UPI0040340282